MSNMGMQTNSTSRHPFPAKGKLIVSAVLQHHGLHPDDFFGGSHEPHLVKARSDAAHRLVAAGYSASLAARILKRNHTTVLNYFSKLRNAKKERRVASLVMRHLSPEAAETVREFAMAENVTPELLMAGWILERATYEAQQRARDAA